MPLSTPVKVLLVGCVVVVVIGMVALGVGGFLIKRWVGQTAHKIENASGGQNSDYGKKAEELQKKYPFQAPSDGLITESQLTRFLAVRKALYTLYQKNYAEIEAMDKQKGNQGFQAAIKGVELIQNLRMTQINALEEQHMSKDEYNYITTTVYTTYFSQLGKAAMQYADQASQMMEKQIEQIDEQLKNPSLSEDAKKELQSQRDALSKQRDELTKSDEVKKSEAQLNSLAQKNLDLFNKHREEITKYSMGGLEFIGL